MVDDVFGNRAGHKVHDVVPTVGADDDQIDTEFFTRLHNDRLRFAFAQLIIDLDIHQGPACRRRLHGRKTQANRVSS